MTFKTTSAICFLAASVVIFFSAMGMAADSLNFAVIQPGQPGTSEDAQPVMDALAAHIREKMTKQVVVKGAYFNRIQPALDFLREEAPEWSIVRLGFYSAHARTFDMTPMASTRPGGRNKDVWWLMAAREGPEDWEALTGRVTGNMLFEPDAAACLLFGLPSTRLPFRLEGTFRPLRSVRDVIRGKISGTVLDWLQYEAVQALPSAEKMAVVHVSQDLPTSPVIWFGEMNDTARKLRTILLDMKEDPDAKTLLNLLQTDGFGPADTDLPKFRRGENAAVCFP